MAYIADYDVCALTLLERIVQGPYVYKLYEYYEFKKGDIAILFIVGFGSSLLIGAVSTIATCRWVS